MAKSKKNDSPRGLLTWLVSGLGMVIIVAALAILTFDATGRSTSANLQVVERSRVTRGAATLIKIEVRNLGGEATAAVQIEGHAQGGETAEVALDYLAGHSSRKATLAFIGDPGPVDLIARSWAEP